MEQSTGIDSEVKVLFEIPMELATTARTYFIKKEYLYGEFSALWVSSNGIPHDLHVYKGRQFNTVIGMDMDIEYVESLMSPTINYLKLKQPDVTPNIIIRKIFACGVLSDANDLLRQELIAKYSVSKSSMLR